MPYFSYYVLWLVLGWLLREPLWLLGILVFLLLRPILPDPGRLFSAWTRLGSLRRQVETNPANATARLELARLYLDLRRPKRALEYLMEARRRFPDDAELLFTSGQALLELRRYDEAIAALDAALRSSARVRFGLPYLVKGDAHYGARRWIEAAQAYEEYLESNSSSVEGYVRLARAALRLRRHPEAKIALEEGLSTYHALRGGMKRRAFGAWVRLEWLRATRFFAPGPLVGFLILFAIATGVVYGGYALWRHELAKQERACLVDPELGETPEEYDRLMRAFELCGSVDISLYDGVYVEVAQWSPPALPSSRVPIRIERGRIFEKMLGPDGPLAEWCFTRVFERSPNRLRAEVVVHEDVGDPGDAWLAEVFVERSEEGLLFGLKDSEDGTFATRRLVRK